MVTQTYSRQVEDSHGSRWLAHGICIVLLVLLSAAGNAALVETEADAYDAVCCESYFQARIGDNTIGPETDNAINRPWEVRSRQGAVDTYFQRTYTSGVSEAFALTYNASLGRLTFTLGADVYQMDFGSNTGWETVGLELRVRDPAINPRTVMLDNLYFQSSGVADTALENSSLFASNAGEPAPRQTALFIQDDTATYLGDFTLSGNMTFAWSGQAAESGDLRFRVGVAGQVASVPLPAAMWLYSFALAGLGWYRRTGSTTAVSQQVS